MHWTQNVLYLCLRWVSLILVLWKSVAKLLLSSERPRCHLLWFFQWADGQCHSNRNPAVLTNSPPRKSPTSNHNVLHSWPEIGNLSAISMDEAQNKVCFAAQGQQKTKAISPPSSVSPALNWCSKHIVTSWSRTGHYHLAGWMHETAKLFLIKNKYRAWQKNENG